MLYIIIAPIRPSAIAKAIIIPCTPRVIPFKRFPSIKSVNELINGTPGTKNKTDVAKAVSGALPKPNTTPIPETSEAAKAANPIAASYPTRWLTRNTLIKSS